MRSAMVRASSWSWVTMTVVTPSRRWSCLISWRRYTRTFASSAEIERSRVVLPHPDGPRKQTNSPSWISSEMSARAVNAPNCLVRRSMRRYALTSASPSPSRGARPLLLGLGLRAVALLPLGEDLRAVQRRPLEVVLDHVLQHVSGDELDGLRHLGDCDHRVSLVAEPHGLRGHRPGHEPPC